MRENVGECEKLRANEGRAKGKTTEKMQACKENGTEANGGVRANEKKSEILASD